MDYINREDKNSKPKDNGSAPKMDYIKKDDARAVPNNNILSQDVPPQGYGPVKNTPEPRITPQPQNYGAKPKQTGNSYQQPQTPPQSQPQSQSRPQPQPQTPPQYQSQYQYQPQTPSAVQPQVQKSSKLSDGAGILFKGLWQITKYIFFGFSVLGNLILLLLIIGIIAAGYSGYKGSSSFSGMGSGAGENYSEYLIMDGTAHERIAIVDVCNVITTETSEALRQQFDIVLADSTIKGIIVRIQSPGGSVVASDQIHHMIEKLSEEKRVPIMAYMAGLAASGGYYTAIACDRIIAEPTTITGSIGVIMQTFTMKQLFEEKLGVQPVTVKSGLKKDWPNSFQDVTPEQRQYLDDKLIRPAYDRFVDLVDKGRPLLSREQITPLADGSIYYAQEAMDNGLIDQIGYLEDAVSALSDQAGLTDPEVFGYQEVFGFADILRMQTSSQNNLLSTGKELVSDMQSPKLMYLWQVD
ncbi:MAG: signal peptide peptidase SppA [Sedimentisphaeraceae bacterium JB056]